MYYAIKTCLSSDRFILNKSTLSYEHLPLTEKQLLSRSQPRSISQFGTKDYNRSVRRAFSRIKLLSYFNSDLQYFITFTYEVNQLKVDTVLKDMKKFLRIERKKDPKLKYIYVFEYQKRGSIHIHMIANTKFETYINDNGFLSLKNWSMGFTSIKQIHSSSFDDNFKPYLYLFKYMTKSQRIGKSFVHISRNFDKIINSDYDEYINKLKGENLLYKEDIEFKTDNDEHHIFIKEYYKE
jgi:hypothetical protein